MRVLLFLVVPVLLISAPARSQGILEVLERSQAVRLAALQTVASDHPQAAVLRADFDRLAASRADLPPLSLQVVTGPVTAECVHGRVIVANASLADLPEGVRLFILAHEIAHAALGHWQQLGALYQRHIPGEVVPASTDPVAGVLGREASQLSHEHELAADAFAWQVVRALGHDEDIARRVFSLHGIQHDTATHPGTRKRLAHLRTLQ